MKFRIKEKIIWIVEQVSRIIQKIVLLNDKRNAFETWIEDKENAEAVKLCIFEAKRLAVHILPKKLSGHIRYGNQDPYRMGKVLGFVSLLLPITKDKLEVDPAFNEEVFSGWIEASGSIRLWEIAVTIVRLLKNRRSRAWIIKFLKG